MNNWFEIDVRVKQYHWRSELIPERETARIDVWNVKKQYRRLYHAYTRLMMDCSALSRNRRNVFFFLRATADIFKFNKKNWKRNRRIGSSRAASEIRQDHAERRSSTDRKIRHHEKKWCAVDPSVDRGVHEVKGRPGTISSFAWMKWELFSRFSATPQNAAREQYAKRASRHADCRVDLGRTLESMSPSRRWQSTTSSQPSSELPLRFPGELSVGTGI